MCIADTQKSLQKPKIGPFTKDIASERLKQSKTVTFCEHIKIS